jgi:bisphosphoglycerate-dependent phosphoglycerate mutase
MKIKNWIACVQDREKWKEVVEKAKLSTRNFSAWKKKNDHPTVRQYRSQTYPIEFKQLQYEPSEETISRRL